MPPLPIPPAPAWPPLPGLLVLPPLPVPLTPPEPTVPAPPEPVVIICPPLPAFYLRPQSVADIVDASVARVLDLLGLPHALTQRWAGEE